MTLRDLGAGVGRVWKTLLTVGAISIVGGRGWVLLESIQAGQASVAATLIEQQRLSRAQSLGFQFVVCGQQLTRENLDPIYCELIVRGDSTYRRVLDDAKQIALEAAARARNGRRD